MMAWVAFWELSSCRQLGQGLVGPIPWTAIRLYMDTVGLTDVGECDYFTYLVVAMDAKYREVMTKRIEAEVARAAKANQGAGRP